jgi:hypothetical protein
MDQVPIELDVLRVYGLLLNTSTSIAFYRVQEVLVPNRVKAHFAGHHALAFCNAQKITPAAMGERIIRTIQIIANISAS